MAVAAEKRGLPWLAGRALLCWHLCSLDAPTVAVVWACALARLCEVRLTAAEICVLGLGTWIVYVLDRLLDGATENSSPDRLQERHRFHSRHQQLLLWLCCVAAAGLIALCRLLTHALVEFYLVLGVPVAAYGLRVHWRLLWPRRSERRRARGAFGPSKETAVAVLFTAAVAAPALFRALPVHRPKLLVMSLLLALLCWFNCALISHAEASSRPSGSDERQRDGRLLAGSAMALSVASIAVLLWGPGHASIRLSAASMDLLWNPSAAVLLSCLLLLTLLLASRDSDGESLWLRVMADVGLLTPLLLLLPRFR